MPINQLIAQGVQPIGRDVPQIAQMLYQRDMDQEQNRRRNELVQIEQAQQQRQNALMDRQAALADEQMGWKREDRAAEQAKAQLGMLYEGVKGGNPQAVDVAIDWLGKVSPMDPRAADMFRKNPAYLVPAMEKAAGMPGALEVINLPGYGVAITQGGEWKGGRPTPAPLQVGPETFGEPVKVVRGGKETYVRLGNRGGERPAPEGYVPTSKPDRGGQSTEIQLAGAFANQSKDFNTVAGQYRRVLAVSAKPSPANDFALIYAFAKIQDPTSVVRETEFAQAAKTGAFGDQVQAAVERVVSGKTLTPQQRADFVSAARNAYTAQEQQWQQSVVAPIKQQADAYQLNFDNIYKDYSVKTPQAAQASGQPQSGTTTATNAKGEKVVLIQTQKGWEWVPVK